MGDLDALSATGKQHRVIADNIAAADSGKTDATGLALAGVPFARVDRAIGQFFIHRTGHHLAHFQRRA